MSSTPGFWGHTHSPTCYPFHFGLVIWVQVPHTWSKRNYQCPCHSCEVSTGQCMLSTQKGETNTWYVSDIYMCVCVYKMYICVYTYTHTHYFYRQSVVSVIDFCIWQKASGISHLCVQRLFVWGGLWAAEFRNESANCVFESLWQEWALLFKILHRHFYSLNVLMWLIKFLNEITTTKL